MAFTVATVKTVYGNQRIHHLTVTADAATGNVDTGLNYIDGVAWAAASAASSSQHVRKNVGAESTALVGVLGISGVASGDEYQITVFGR